MTTKAPTGLLSMRDPIPVIQRIIELIPREDYPGDPFRLGYRNGVMSPEHADDDYDNWESGDTRVNRAIAISDLEKLLEQVYFTPLEELHLIWRRVGRVLDKQLSGYIGHKGDDGIYVVHDIPDWIQAIGMLMRGTPIEDIFIGEKDPS